MQKYFLAILPEDEFLEKVTTLKLAIRDQYHAKYALKSPAHITVKMPFIYNEAKEAKLIERLKNFMSAYQGLTLTIKGVKTFGTRVIYLGVEAPQELYEFQRELKAFCKRELNLVDELSDRNFEPHMTIAFKDIKKEQFQNIVQLARESKLEQEFCTHHLALLKRSEGTWYIHKKIEMA